MKTSIQLLGALISAFALICTNQAQAQTRTKSISINPYGIQIEGNARLDNGYNGIVGAQGVVLGDPDDGIGSFFLGFTVPEDYAPGTTMYLRVLWRSDAISCVIDLRNNSLYRSPGAGLPTDSGALVRETTLLAPNNLVQTDDTLYELRGLGTIGPGDAIQGGLFRASSLDSCAGDFHILGLSILYEALTELMFLDGFENVA